MIRLTSTHQFPLLDVTWRLADMGALSWVGTWVDIEKNCPMLATSTCAAHASGAFTFPYQGIYRLPAPSLMGTSPLYYIAAASHRLPTHPVLIGGVAILSGYLGSWFKGLLRYDLEFGRFLRSYQRTCLRIAKRAGFRWCILGGQSRLYFPGIVTSVSVAGFFLWFGIHRFRRTENSFADPT